MTKWLSATVAGLLAAVGIEAAPQPAQAAEIILLASQGSISGARDMAEGFARASGHKVTARQERNTIATINAGTPADLAIANPPVIDDLIKQGKVVGPRV